MLRLGSADGGMALVTGVPGAGKTQLGKRFADEATQHDGGDVRCLAVEPELLLGGLDLFKAMGEALDGADEFRKIAEIDTKVVNRGGGLGPVKGNITHEHVRQTGEFAALLRASKSAKAWKGKALVVLVDELQGVQPGGMAALRVMHQGLHGCPLLLVGIGLQHTPRVLANPADGSTGISRLGMRLRLGALSAAEALEAVEKGMARCNAPYTGAAPPLWRTSPTVSRSTSTATWQVPAMPSRNTASWRPKLRSPKRCRRDAKNVSTTTTAGWVRSRSETEPQCA